MRFLLGYKPGSLSLSGMIAMTWVILIKYIFIGPKRTSPLAFKSSFRKTSTGLKVYDIEQPTNPYAIMNISIKLWS